MTYKNVWNVITIGGKEWHATTTEGSLITINTHNKLSIQEREIYSSSQQFIKV